MRKQAKTERRLKAKPVQSSPHTTEDNKPSFPIVGMGASAGGLEALELFFANLPSKSGMAFIVVQHLDPTHKGILVELLQRATSMPVAQIADRMPVEPNKVYVIPPSRDLSILHGVLHLFEPSAPHGLRLPIDFFLRALAEDQAERGIAVILSGMGSDGSLGLRAIKEKSGAVFVQSPESAKFDGMPRSAIDSGLADVIAPVEQLPARIVSYIQNVPLPVAGTDSVIEESSLSGLEKIIQLLRTQTGHDFSLYKKSTLYRRIERRMGLHQLPRITDYVRYLRENAQEANLLFKELLIGVTSFFRDPEVWEQLKAEVIPALLDAYPSGGTLRAWTPGCSTGEEAYSLAMIFREVLAQRKTTAHYALQIFATDLDKEAIDKARGGVYPANITADISAERLRRFFVEEGRGYRVSKEIREMVIFAQQNLVMDPPFTKLDLLTCRNLLIYLQPELQKKLLRLFHYSLNPGGILLLGSAETAGQSGEFFVQLPGKTRHYRRHDQPVRVDLVGFPAAFASSRAVGLVETAAPLSARSVPNLQLLTETLLLQHFTPAAVLTTGMGDLLYISGKIGKYLEPASGKANLNLFAMAREGLSSALYEAFHRSLRENTTVKVKGVSVEPNTESPLIDLTVQPLADPEELRGMVLIAFSDAVAATTGKVAGKTRRSAGQDAQLTSLTLELQKSREELQTTREEMQSSQEELRSANEELQSTNEELQSTNEELTTSKEEMQSMNEELQTVNQELRAKVDELSRISDDMKNLLNSTDIATLFLDAELRVRRFTKQTSRIFKLIPGDVGRPITDIVSELDYPNLTEDVRDVIQSLVLQERQVVARTGQWFSIRIMPYRTQDNRIDGVVITFINISQAKTLEASLREALAALQNRFAAQSVELDRIQLLEQATQKAQAVLESQLKMETSPSGSPAQDLQMKKEP